MEVGRWKSFTFYKRKRHTVNWVKNIMDKKNDVYTEVVKSKDVQV